jgi:transcriptional regulator with XRE-family HTH domain
MGLRNDALIHKRIKSGLTKEKIAELAGVHVGTYLRWEQGRIPTLRNIRRLCDILQATPEDLGYDKF